MIDDPVLLNDWHPVLRSDALPNNTVRGTRLLGLDIVLWRTHNRAHAWRDLCLHRGAQLSLGGVENGRLACAYHGWQYDEDGTCGHIPAHAGQTPQPKLAPRHFTRMSVTG